MDNEPRIISCINADCAQRLRIPSDRTRLFVTCPKCQTKWTWTTEEPPEVPEEAPVEPRPRRSLISIAIVLVAALVLIAGVSSRAWLPTSLFALSSLVAWIFRRKLSKSEAVNLWEKGVGVLYEATAGLCFAIAAGLAMVIGLVTFLNLYPDLSPGNYPAWLLKLEEFLIKFSAWNQSSNNRSRITIIYLSVIALCFVVSLVARRYKKEWKPVRHLTGFKRTANKVVLAIQVVALFTLFSQTPVNEHVDKLAQQTAWRYGVAKRAEQQFEAKRLIAEELTRAAKDRKDADQDEKSAFAQSISDLRNQLAAPITSSPSPSPSPNGPTGWRPLNWPRPPDVVVTRIQKGAPLKASDYQPAPAVPEQLKGADTSIIAEANKFVATQVEGAIPRQPSAFPDPIRSDPNAASVFPPKTTAQWQAAKELVAEQEIKADLAKQRYGEAVEMLLEGISEYLGMNIQADDPIVGTWIDLALNAITDRVHEHLFSKDSERFAKVTEQLRDLFTPREAKAARLKEQIDEHLKALDYDAAEPLIAELQQYPKTKAGKSWAPLDEVVSFEKVSRSLASSDNLDETITRASDYLSHHSGANRAQQVRNWLASATDEKKRIEIQAEIEAAKPRMLVYVRETCPMSKYFLEHTSQDPMVMTEQTRFSYKELNVDITPPSVRLGPDVFLPIVVFKDRNGKLLDVVTGTDALNPMLMSMYMRAVADGRHLNVRTTENPLSEICPLPGSTSGLSRWIRRF